MSFSNGITNIDGVNVVTTFERTSNKVSADFQTQMALLQTYLNSFTGATPGNPPWSPPANPTLAEVQAAITALRDLAVKGETTNVDPNNPNSPLKHYVLTDEMAQSLDVLFRTLNLAGVQFPSDGTSPIVFPPQNLPPSYSSNWNIVWQDLAVASPLVNNVFHAALQAVQDNGSLQSMIELGYIKTANDVLGKQLSSLEGALDTTKGVLNALGNLQDLHNQVKIYNSNFAFPYAGGGISDGSAYVQQYRSAASGFFGSPLAPVLSGDYYQLPDYLNFLSGRVADGSVSIVFGIVADVKLAPGTVVPPSFLSRYGMSLVEPPPNAGFDTYRTEDLPHIVLFFNEFKAMSDINNSNGYYIVRGGAGTNFTTSAQLFSKIQGQNPAASDITALNLGKPALTGQINQLISLRNQLSAQIRTLSATTPSASLGDANSLYGRLQTVLADIKSVFVLGSGGQPTSSSPLSSTYAGFLAWMEDSYNTRNTTSSGSAGKIQQDLTNAITAGQSLNDTQKESVRRFLYVFEEYYKSASAILTKITQILERLAQGIAR